MKKLITGSVILALALAGAPQASAFSFGSSGSSFGPTESVSVDLERLKLDYQANLALRGYAHSDEAELLARRIAEADEEGKDQLERDLIGSGGFLSVRAHQNSQVREDGRELANVPSQPWHGAGSGVHVQPEGLITVAYVVYLDR